jgi:hypothetical protein
MDAANEAANQAESKRPVQGSPEWHLAEALRLQAAEAADEFIAALLFADCPADESAMPADTR